MANDIKWPGDGRERISFLVPEKMKRDLMVYLAKDGRKLTSYMQILIREDMKRIQRQQKILEQAMELEA